MLRPISNYSPCKIEGKNKEQKFAIDLLLNSEIPLVTVVGLAGSGKTLLAIASGLHQVIDAKRYKSLIICRPIQPLGKDIGYLPGTLEEKLEPWIAPIKDNLRYLLSADGKKSKRGEETMQMLFENGTIEVEAMTFIRGRSIANAFIIIDEAQNLNAHELKTIITRVGEGTKIVLTGDIEQIDNMYVDSVSNGLTIAIEKFKDSEISGHVTLTKGERSSLATIAASIL
jgi:PhoH-like ATPase